MKYPDYWSEDFELEVVEIKLESGQKSYPLNNISGELASGAIIKGIGVRVPNANAYTQDGNPLIDDTIFHALHFKLNDGKGGEVMHFPASLAAFRSGGDNNFLRISDRQNIDFDNRKSEIVYSGTDGNLTTAVGAGRAIEFFIFYKPVC